MPYPNWWAIRLHEPNKQKYDFRTKHINNSINFIIGFPKGGGKSFVQAIRLSKDKYKTMAEAKAKVAEMKKNAKEKGSKLFDVERTVKVESIAKTFDEYLKEEALTDKKKEVFINALGFDPDTKKFIPIDRKTYTCPKCKKNDAYMRTSGEDTSNEEHYLWCPDCKISSEMP